MGGTFPPLRANLSVDVAIVGGGITGISAAAQLVRAGRSVVVLEANVLGAGTTGYSTGNLYAPVSEGISRLSKTWGQQMLGDVMRSRLSAIKLISQNVSEHRINCDFKRQSWSLYSTEGSAADLARIEMEYDAAHRTGLDVRFALDLPLPYPLKKAIVISNQAQFNPCEYVLQLATAIRSPQCRIFENAVVCEIDDENGIVHTADHAVHADHIILATHTPKGFAVVQTELAAYREYAVAGRQDLLQLPGGIFWEIGSLPSSTRSVRINGNSYVLMIGEKHKTGQNEDTGIPYRNLEERLRARFDIRSVAFRWSAQNYRPADGLPYIGSIAGASNVYIATGFGNDGLTYGTLAAMMIADEISGIQNPWAELYSPRRFTPVKSAVKFLKENLNVAGYYIKGYSHTGVGRKLSDVPRGDGELIDIDGATMAVYCDESDQLHIVSPVCTHLKCIVQWNRAERSWDCPCHGSRFDYDGNVIEGPALHPLQRHDVIRKVTVADRSA
jgi:glycine/D-amino acid oxidase-like deaminating enzyme/nitrite reductase/ring-hydroxylating ferredoxin subunit